MRRILCVLLTFFGVSLWVNAAAPDMDDLPSVPFMIGGDDAVSPAENISGGPVMTPPAPEVPAKTEASSLVAQVPQLSASPMAAQSSEPKAGSKTSEVKFEAVSASATPLPAAPVAAQAPVVAKPAEKAIALSGDLDAPLSLSLPAESVVTPPAKVEATPVTIVAAPVPALTPVPTPKAPEAVATAPTVVPSPVAPGRAPAAATFDDFPELPVASPAAAPVVAVPPAPEAKPEGWMQLKPAEAPVAAAQVPYELNEPKKPLEVTVADGTTQIKGLEHSVGKDNKLLPPVQLSPAIAVVGENFPELHVDQIPVEDLMSYLKDFSARTIRVEMPAPLYVTVDLKAKSVEEVLGYLSARYPIEVSADANTIFIRPASAKPVEALPQSFYAQGPATSGVPPTPRLSAVPAVSATSNIAYLPAAPVPAAMPAAPAYAEAPLGVVGDWEQVRLKAKLYDLERQRQALLTERQKIHSNQTKRWIHE